MFERKVPPLWKISGPLLQKKKRRREREREGTFVRGRVVKDLDPRGGEIQAHDLFGPMISGSTEGGAHQYSTTPELWKSIVNSFNLIHLFALFLFKKFSDPWITYDSLSPSLVASEVRVFNCSEIVKIIQEEERRWSLEWSMQKI